MAKVSKKGNTWPMVKLKEVLDYEQPTNYVVQSANYDDTYKTPVLTAGKSFLLGYTNEDVGIFPQEKLPVIIFDDFTTASKFVDFPFKVKSSAMKILTPRNGVEIKFVFHMMTRIKFNVCSHKRYWISEYSNLSIPLPPLSEQKAIASLLEKWDIAIEKTEALIAAKQKQLEWLMSCLINSQLDNPNWKKVRLGEIYNISAGGDFNPKEASLTRSENYPYPIYSNALTNKGLYGYSTFSKYDEDSVTVTARGDIGKANHRKTKFVAIGRLLVLKNKIPVLNEFVCLYINYKVRFFKETTGVPQLTAPQASRYYVILPPLSEQKAITSLLEKWDISIEKTKALAELYRIQKRGLKQKLLTGEWRLNT